jgi:hypothetical protein
LISAPGDVLPEDIAAVRDTVARWNAIYGQEFGAVVVPIHWQLHSAAEHGDRPQATLNKQLVDAVDILVALFWHRLGSPTGEADSGTVEEIEEAHERGAYVGILRCIRDLPHDADPEQLAKLQGYYEHVRPNSLILDYGDDGALDRHVDAILNRAITQRSARAEAAVEEPQAAGAAIWPRVEMTEHAASDPRGRPTTKRQWQLVLANTGTEPARNVRYRLEAEDEDDNLPLEVGDVRPLEVLAPEADARYQLILHMGVAPQARCVVSWEDSAGEHENQATLRFF